MWKHVGVGKGERVRNTAGWRFAVHTVLLVLSLAISYYYISILLHYYIGGCLKACRTSAPSQPRCCCQADDLQSSRKSRRLWCSSAVSKQVPNAIKLLHLHSHRNRLHTSSAWQSKLISDAFSQHSTPCQSHMSHTPPSYTAHQVAQPHHAQQSAPQKLCQQHP